MTWAPDNSRPGAGAEIDPAKVTSVDLIDAGAVLRTADRIGSTVESGGSRSCSG